MPDTLPPAGAPGDSPRPADTDDSASAPWSAPGLPPAAPADAADGAPSPPALTPPSAPMPPLGSAPAAATGSSPGSRVGSALGIAALALGVLAVLGAAVPVVNLASAGFATAGAGLGIAALFLLSRGRGLALAGTVTSVIALVVSVALALVYSGVVMAASTAAFGWTSGSVYSSEYDEEADETIATTDDSAPPGTFDAPLPLGETIVVTRDGEPRWEITFTDATFDALDEVQAANPGTDVARNLVGGLAQYAYVSAEVTYLGEGSATILAELYISFAATADLLYYPGEIPVSAPGTDLYAAEDDIRSGETLEGNILVALAPGAEETGRWSVGGEWTEFLYVEAQ